MPRYQAKSRLDFIDGLRGFACLYVVSYHLFLLWPVSSHTPGGGGLLALELATRLAAYGHIGVDIFLALSGFCLFYPICRRAQAGNGLLPSIVLTTFARRRARRILPPYVAALVFFSLLPLWNDWATYVHQIPTAADFASHLVLIHNFFPATILSIDGPLWSLALEAQLYVAFPLLVGLFRWIGVARFAVLVFAGSLAFRLVAWHLLGGRSLPFEAQFALMNGLPGRLIEFAAGMVAAYVVTRQGEGGRQHLRITALAAIVFGAALAYGTDKLFGEHSPLPPLFWGVVAFGLIVGASDGVLSPLRLFNWRPLVRIGLFSYSIYLLHEPLLRLTGAYAARAGLAPLPALVAFVCLVAPALLAVCAAFFFIFERPFMQSRAAVRERASSGQEEASFALA